MKTKLLADFYPRGKGPTQALYSWHYSFKSSKVRAAIYFALPLLEQCDPKRSFFAKKKFAGLIWGEKEKEPLLPSEAITQTSLEIKQFFDKTSLEKAP